MKCDNCTQYQPEKEIKCKDQEFYSRAGGWIEKSVVIETTNEVMTGKRDRCPGYNKK